MVGLYDRCWSCKGTGQCSRCSKIKDPNSTEPYNPNEKKSDKCRSCGGTKVCRTCKGSKYRENTKFLGGPRIYTDLPDFKIDKIDKIDNTTPEGAFEAFSRGAHLYKAVQRSSESRMWKGFKAFAEFFFPPRKQPKARTRKYNGQPYKMVKVLEKSETSARVQFARGAEEGPSDSQYQAVLVKEKDHWVVDSIQGKCWRCSGKGKQPYGPNKGAPCPHCSGTGFSVQGYLP